MQRREFITLVGGAAAWSLAAQAQNGTKTFRIAMYPAFAPQIADMFAAEMQSRGWTPGRDLVIEKFGPDPREEGARLVVASKPDLIVTVSTAHTLAARRLTDSIPIVMLTSGYPVEAGLADSLARPGRNVTGNSLYASSGVWGKILQLLREAKPGIERVGVVWSYVTPAFPKEEVEPCFAELAKAARSLGLKLEIVEGWQPDFPAALAKIEAGNPDGLVLTSFATPSGLSALARFAADKGLPSITDVDWALADVSPLPLLSYGPVFRGLVSRAAASVDKIFRGARAGDLPIQNPDRFELVVNLKTARSIGLSLPERFLMLADKVND